MARRPKNGNGNGNGYSPEVKAQVMAALLAGQSISEVATAYRVPIGTVKSWKARNKGGMDAPVATDATTKKAEIGDLILEYLRENLITVKAQLAHFRDKAWLSKQGAAELATLHGVTVDKAFRLLEALQNTEDDQPDA